MDEYVGAFRNGILEYLDLFAPPSVIAMANAVTDGGPESMLAFPHTAFVGDERGLGFELLRAISPSIPVPRNACGIHVDLRSMDVASSHAAMDHIASECNLPHFRHRYHVVTVALGSNMSAGVVSRMRAMVSGSRGYARLFVSAPPDPAAWRVLSAFTVIRCKLPTEQCIFRALERFSLVQRVPNADPEWLALLAARCDRCIHAALLWLKSNNRAPCDPSAELCAELLEIPRTAWTAERVSAFVARALSRGVGIRELSSGLAIACSRVGADDTNVPGDIIRMGADLDWQSAVMTRVSMRNTYYHVEWFVIWVLNAMDRWRV